MIGAFIDRPRFECHRYQGAQLNSSDVSITCVLRHNPEPSELYVTWHHGGHHRIDAENSQSDDNYRLMTSVGVIETMIKTTSLTL